MGSSLLGFLRLLGYGAFTCALIPLQAAMVALKLPARTTVPLFYHTVCARILGLRIETVGRPATVLPGKQGPGKIEPVLFASNHSSYLDIIVLGGLIPGSFVAKTDVAGWPFFGLLAKLQRTVFVDRKARNAGIHRDDMRSRLEDGDSLILFPEGTSSDGNRTLPFKSALFSVASLRIGDRPLVVQPVSIACTALDGIPLGRTMRHVYAWYGDMELVGHVWQMVRLGRLTVRVEFHAPVTVEAFGSRKALADHCWREVSAGVDRAVAGRDVRERRGRRVLAPVPAGA